MARKRADTLEREEREIEWIRTHPRAFLEHLREHKRNRALVAQGIRQMDAMQQNLDLAWAAHERMNLQRTRLREALKLAATRLEILTGRMRACHEETGKHELLEEAEAFAAEARAVIEETKTPP